MGTRTSSSSSADSGRPKLPVYACETEEKVTIAEEQTLGGGVRIEHRHELHLERRKVPQGVLISTIGSKLAYGGCHTQDINYVQIEYKIQPLQLAQCRMSYCLVFTIHRALRTCVAMLCM